MNKFPQSLGTSSNWGLTVILPSVTSSRSSHLLEVIFVSLQIISIIIHVNLPLITWTMLWVPDKSKKVHCSPKHWNYFNDHVFIVFKKSPSIIPIMWNPEYSPGIEPWCFLLQSMIKFVCLLVCFVFVFFMHPEGIPVWENNGTPTLVRPKSEI